MINNSLKLCLIAMLLIVSFRPMASVQAEEKMYIDSRLPLKEKELLRKVMQNLDETDRENVIYIAEDGSFTANKLDLYGNRSFQRLRAS